LQLTNAFSKQYRSLNVVEFAVAIPNQTSYLWDYLMGFVEIKRGRVLGGELVLGISQDIRTSAKMRFSRPGYPKINGSSLAGVSPQTPLRS